MKVPVISGRPTGGAGRDVLRLMAGMGFALALIAGAADVGAANAGAQAEPEAEPDELPDVPAYFIGNVEYGSVGLNAERPKELIETIRAVCAKGGRLWAFGSDVELSCDGFDFVEEPCAEPYYAVRILSGAKKFEGGPYLFSVKPFPAYRWQSRATARAEAADVAAVFQSEPEKYRAAAAAFASGKAQAFDTEAKDATIYFIPWAPPDDETAARGGVKRTPDYLVAVRKGGRVYSAGGFAGKIMGLIDIDGDGLPEIYADVCGDNTCASLFSVSQFSVNGKLTRLM